MKHRNAGRQSTEALLALLLLLLAPASALAHVQKGEAAGFLSGFHHPLSGWDHILAMVAVGLWGAELGAPAIWLLPVTFPMMMAVGGFLGLIGVPLPGVEVGIAASAIVLGLMVALEARPKLRVAMAMVGVFAIYHGHAHGSELAPGASALAYSLGFVVATGCLHATGITIGLVHRWRPGRIALRVAGAAVALAGLGSQAPDRERWRFWASWPRCSSSWRSARHSSSGSSGRGRASRCAWWEAGSLPPACCFWAGACAAGAEVRNTAHEAPVDMHVIRNRGGSSKIRINGQRGRRNSGSRRRPNPYLFE